MTTSSLALSAQCSMAGRMLTRLPFLIALVAAADALLCSQPLGLSVAAFGLLVFAASVGSVARRPGGRHLIGLAIAVVAVIPIVMQVTFATVLVAVVGVAVAMLIGAHRFSGPMQRRLERLAWLVAGGPWQIAADARAMRHAWQRNESSFRGELTAWLLPASLGLVFLGLFISANPIFTYGLSHLPAADLGLSGARIAFWLVAACLLWPTLRIAWKRSGRTGFLDTIKPDPPLVAPLLDRYATAQAVRRSLLLFNLIFAAQSISDIAYLWAGATLPAGLTYSEYARRSAYPLVAAALLAAVFVLIALRENAPVKSRSEPWLIVLWVGQTLLLVASSIFRTTLYVSAYSLTYTRFYAFVLMGLIGAGLVLILIRLAFGLRNRWLVGANLAVFAVTFYAAALANVPGLIAHHNVTHSREFTGEGAWLDTRYLVALGPQAAPAIDLYLSRVPGPRDVRDPGGDSILIASHRRFGLEADIDLDWRSWTYWGARLRAYERSRRLDHQPPPP